MADIFISFKTEDTPRVQPIHDGFLARGYSVFWSNHIPIGSPDYQARIRQELLAASIVVVVWTHASVESGPVVQEAKQAERAKKLIQVLLDDIQPMDHPMDVSFRAQKAMLLEWTGNKEDTEWIKLNSAIDTQIRPGALPLHAERLRGAVLAMGVQPAVIDRIVALRGAAANGDPSAMIELACLYESGDLLTADLNEAGRLYNQAGGMYKAAAEKGDPSAMANLGLMQYLDLFSTRPGGQDSAIDHFNQAAAKGDADAKAMLTYLTVGPPETHEDVVKLLTRVHVLISRFRPYFVMKHLITGMNKDWYEDSLENEVRIEGKDQFSVECRRAMAAFWEFYDSKEKFYETAHEEDRRARPPEMPPLLKYVFGAYPRDGHVKRWLPHYDL